MSQSLASGKVALPLLILIVSTALSLPAESRAQADAETPKMVDFWRPGDPGERMNIRGRVTGMDGEPIAGARIALRQADGTGTYREQYSGVITSNDKGNYQFGSVVPANYSGQRHVHVDVHHDGYRYLNTRILFKDDPNLASEADPRAVFLEEGNVDGEKMLFGRFDITLVPR